MSEDMSPYVTAHAKMSHLSARFLRTYEPHLHCTDILFETAHAKMSHLSARFLRTYEPHLHCTDILFEIEVPPGNVLTSDSFTGGTSISKSMSVQCRCGS